MPKKHQFTTPSIPIFPIEIWNHIFSFCDVFFLSTTTACIHSSFHVARNYFWSLRWQSTHIDKTIHSFLSQNKPVFNIYFPTPLSKCKFLAWNSLYHISRYSIPVQYQQASILALGFDTQLSYTRSYQRIVFCNAKDSSTPLPFIRVPISIHTARSFVPLEEWMQTQPRIVVIAFDSCHTENEFCPTNTLQCKGSIQQALLCYQYVQTHFPTACIIAVSCKTPNQTQTVEESMVCSYFQTDGVFFVSMELDSSEDHRDQYQYLTGQAFRCIEPFLYPLLIAKRVTKKKEGKSKCVLF